MAKRKSDHSPDLDAELTAAGSPLRDEGKFGDALDFEGYEEGVPGRCIIFGAMPIRKKSFEDPQNGIWVGVDRDGLAKAIFGDDQDYITILPSTGEISVFNGGERRTDLSGGSLNFYTTTGVASGGIFGLGTNQLAFTNGGDGTFYLTDTGIIPVGAGVISLGNSTDYWNDVSYKTLTDRGCLGWYDRGVELQDGRVVSDVEALKAIRPHPTRKTPRGAVRLDYGTMPKDVYVRAADEHGNELPRDEHDQPYQDVPQKDGTVRRVVAEDGAETTALIAVMLGAIRELAGRVETLEAQVASLQKPKDAV